MDERGGGGGGRGVEGVGGGKRMGEGEMGGGEGMEEGEKGGEREEKGWERVVGMDGETGRGLPTNAMGSIILCAHNTQTPPPPPQGKAAIHSPYTGIVDYGVISRSYASDFQSMGGQVYTNFDVSKFNLIKSPGKYPLGCALVS